MCVVGLGEIQHSLQFVPVVHRVFMIRYMDTWGAVLLLELVLLVSIQVVWMVTLRAGRRIQGSQIMASTHGTRKAPISFDHEC
jgi:hypothetical protein